MIHVVDPSAVAVCDEVAGCIPPPDKVSGNAADQMRTQASFVEAGVTTKSFTTEGHDAAQTLMELAHQHHADLIVAGTQSKTGVERLFLGSTAEKLIRAADCPVLTIGPSVVWPADGPLEFRCIVYATDFSAQSAKAARYALAFAAQHGARLCCCYVENSESEVPAMRADTTADFTEALRHMMPENGSDIVKPEFFVEHGDPAEGILVLAAKVGADLIVLGPRKASFWLKYVNRGLTPSVLAEAKCPVMTIC
jgi:nucleotide-binding universal stress UspA family protein